MNTSKRSIAIAIHTQFAPYPFSAFARGEGG